MIRTQRTPHRSNETSIPDPYFSNHQMEQLPDYDTGLRVSKSTSKSPEQLVITVDQGAGSIFNRGQSITGNVIISPRKCTLFENILIDFQKCEFLTRKGMYSDSSVRRVSSIARYVFTPDAFPPEKLLNKGFVYSFSYTLTVPHELPEDECPHGLVMHRQLSPTLGTPFKWCDQSSDVPDKSVVLVYRIRARVMLPANSSQKSADWRQFKYIRVNPVYAPMPLRRDLFCNTTALRVGKIKKQEVGNITLQYQEQPIIFLTRGISTIKILLTAPSNLEQPQIKRLSYSISAITTSSTTPVNFYPNGRDHQVYSINEIIQSARAVFHETCFESESSGYNNIVTFDICLPSDKHGLCQGVIPNYFSCLSSRQYELQISISFTETYLPVVSRVPLVVGASHDAQLWIKDEDTDPVPPYCSSPNVSVTNTTPVELGSRQAGYTDNLNGQEQQSVSEDLPIAKQ